MVSNRLRRLLVEEMIYRWKRLCIFRTIKNKGIWCYKKAQGNRRHQSLCEK